MISLELIGPMSQSEMELLLNDKRFNAPFDAYIAAHYKHETDHLTDEQKAEVALWWKGHLPKGFWDTVSRPAHDAILTLCSLGLG